MTNTLAYYDKEIIAAVKKLYTIGPWVFQMLILLIFDNHIWQFLAKKYIDKLGKIYQTQILISEHIIFSYFSFSFLRLMGNKNCTVIGCMG
jgi:hypothetical protein